MSKVGKTAIEIAAAHTDAIIIPVERNERRNNQIQLSRGDYFAINWLPKSETISK